MIDPSLMAKIRQRAYELWEDEGRPEGRDRIHWLRAEAEFRETLCASRPANPGAKPKASKSSKPGSRGARTDVTH
jgi:Protein of unknown function (DUF2934)